MVENESLDPRESLEEVLLQEFHLLLLDAEIINDEEIEKLVNLIKEESVTVENILDVLQNSGEIEGE